MNLLNSIKQAVSKPRKEDAPPVITTAAAPVNPALTAITTMENRQAELREAIADLEKERTAAIELAARGDVAQSGFVTSVNGRLKELDGKISARQADVALLDQQITDTRALHAWQLEVGAAREAHDLALEAQQAFEKALLDAAAAFRTLKMATTNAQAKGKALKVAAAQRHQELPGFVNGSVAIRRFGYFQNELLNTTTAMAKKGLLDLNRI
ncbi:MAG TPA: hypothetical protein VGO93_28690 [Candidatus Xenobia bacterium]